MQLKTLDSIDIYFQTWIINHVNERTWLDSQWSELLDIFGCLGDGPHTDGRSQLNVKKNMTKGTLFLLRNVVKWNASAKKSCHRKIPQTPQSEQ